MARPARASATTRRQRRGTLLFHTRAAREGWTHIRENRLASVVSIAVMAVAIGLPALLFALFESQQTLLSEWGAKPSLSVFLDKNVTLAEAELLAGSWREDSIIEAVEVIPASLAFAELRRSAGLDDGAEAMDNPLPHVIVVTPQAATWQGDQGSALTARLKSHSGVDTVVVDLDWVARLDAIGALVRRGLWVLAVVLVGGTALIVGNTVRALVQAQAAEIEVLRLVGATDAYIRRPFLYSGSLHGLGAGIAAAVLIEGVFLALAEPVRAVARAYRSDFELGSPALSFILALVAFTAMIGWCGAWMGTFMSLRRLDPESNP